MRPASHHPMSSACRRVPARPNRKGSVYREIIVPHTPATSTAAGRNRASAKPMTPKMESAPSTKWKTFDCQSTIHDNPAQIQCHSVERIQLHCSDWTLPMGCCMYGLPVSGRPDDGGRARSPVRQGIIDKVASRPVKHCGRDTGHAGHATCAKGPNCATHLECR